MYNLHTTHRRTARHHAFDPACSQPFAAGKDRANEEGVGTSSPRAGSLGARGPPEPCETGRQASADPLVWAQLLAVSAQRSPDQSSNQGPEPHLEGWKSVGTWARVLSAKEQIPFDRFRFFHLRPMPAANQRLRPARGQHHGHDLRARQVTCSPPSCCPAALPPWVAVSFGQRQKQIMYGVWLDDSIGVPRTWVGRGNRV